MNGTPEKYDEVVRVYIHLINQDSPEAGALIEQLRSTFGARAALRATLVLTLLKMEVKENYRVPDLSIYGHIVEDYPEAVLLLEQAIIHCCRAWGIADLEHVHLHSGKPRPSMTSQEPFHRPDSRFRRFDELNNKIRPH